MKFSKTKLSILFSVIALIAVFVCIKIVSADVNSDIYGWGWSSNIGWVSLNDCSNPADSGTCNPAASYGLNALLAAPGTLTGYAWSSSIGWITFNDATCPTKGCTPGAYIDWAHPNADGSTPIRGWARACDVYASGCSGALKGGTGDTNNPILGGWDGYISLDSVSGGSNNAYGVQVNSDDTIGGFAWGSDIVGWLNIDKDFSHIIINTNGLTVTLTANPPSILEGGKSTLTTIATNIDGPNACSLATSAGVAVPGLVMAEGANNVWSGNVIVSPNVTTPYVVTCTKGTQSASATATVTVTNITTPTCTPGDPNCNNGNNGINNNGYCAAIGSDPELSWDSDGTSCTITEGSNSVTVAGNSGFTQVQLPMPDAKSATYTLQCNGTVTTPVSVTVQACAPTFELNASPIDPPVLTVGSDPTQMSESFLVSATPSEGFIDPITLAIAAWSSPTSSLPAIPDSKSFTFTPTKLIYDPSTGQYSTSILTISVASQDVKQTEQYSPITISGTGTPDGLVETAPVNVNAVVKVKPIFNEF